MERMLMESTSISRSMTWNYWNCGWLGRTQMKNQADHCPIVAFGWPIWQWIQSTFKTHNLQVLNVITIPILGGRWKPPHKIVWNCQFGTSTTCVKVGRSHVTCPFFRISEGWTIFIQWIRRWDY
jgi:hypothetical protein